tara:strand:+ start:359 stop:1663 length:1305 start_codon:yes stop_codon:yes gene_type:complete
MKILLINPKDVGRGQASVRFMASTPLGLNILAALAPEEDSVKIINENYRDIPYEEEVDLVGITSMLHASGRALDIAKKFRSRGVKVVMGGFFVSLWPQKAEDHVDSIVIGEAENVWNTLLEDFRSGKLKKRYQTSSFADLSNVPFISKKWFANEECYHVETSRGCPFHCDFCCVTRFYKGTLRHRPIADVVRQIHECSDKMIFFVDDNIAINKKYAKELFKALTPLKISWSGQFSINAANDDELLTLCAKSGCKLLFTGFETLNSKNLDDVDKSWMDTEKFPGLIENIHKHGIGVYGSFMFGFEKDTSDIFHQTLMFCEENKLDLALFSAIFPVDGSKFHKQLKAENRIFEKDSSKFNGQHSTFKTKNMTSRELDDGLRWIWKEFYSKPSMKKRVGHMLDKRKKSTLSTQRNNLSAEEVMIAVNTAFRVAVTDF